MFSPNVWGTEIRDAGYLHARSGAAQALLRLGERERARDVAEAELADVKVFGAPRALGIALRVAGLAHGGSKGIELLSDSVASLRSSLEQCSSGRIPWPSWARRCGGMAAVPLRANR